MLEAKTVENTSNSNPVDNTIELGNLKDDTNNDELEDELEDKIHIERDDDHDGDAEIDDDDINSMESFQPVVFYCLRREKLPRLLFVKLVSWSYFERISIFVILCNCVTLGLYDPFDPDCNTQRCKILEQVELGIYVFFVVEMLCKWLAMGIFGKLGYISENWNKLDCFIVAAGTFELFYDKGKYMTAVRAIRVLRPLRAINRVPSIRILVTLLLDTLPMLGNVLAMCSLIFSIFGIVGVQMWQGLLRNRCVLELPPNISAQTYNLSLFYKPSSGDLVCSLPKNSGLKRCTKEWITPYRQDGRDCSLDYESYVNKTIRSNYTNACVNWNQYYSKCGNVDINPEYDTISFDNILIAWVAIFQVITLEGWSDIMYFIQDANSQWDFIYFVILIVIGSYFMTNLCLVVITTQFQETKQRENDLMRQGRHKRSNSSSTIASSRFGRDGCWVEILKYIAHMLRKTKRRLVRRMNLKCCEPVTHKTRVTKKRKRRKKKLVYHHHHHHHHYHHYHHHVHCPGHCQHQIDGYCPVPDGHFSPNVSTTDINSNAQPIDAPTGNTLTVPGQITGRLTPNGSCQGEDNDTNGTQDAADLPGTVPNVSIVTGSVCSIRPSTASNKLGEMITTATAAVNVNGQSALSDVATQSFVSAASLSSAAATATASAAVTSVIQNACECAVGRASAPRDKGVDIEEFESESVYEGEESETSDYSDDEFHKDKGKMTACMKCRRSLRDSVESKWFMFVIMGAIFINTLSMGIEYYGQPKKMTDVLEIMNYIFAGIFALEMLIKLIAISPYGYIKDAFNLFDGTIVIISVVELFGDGNNNISVLRSFRLLRIFKLVRFLPALKRQLLVMIHTMDNVVTFLALLGIFIFTASILGMNLFGGKYHFQDESGKMYVARANFDDLFWAIVTVFQILTQEDWNVVMRDGMRATGKWAGFYFILLMTIGNYILFNLLVAILVEGFANQPDKNGSSANIRQSTALLTKSDYNQLAKRTECTMVDQSVAKFYNGSKPRVCISPTPSVYYVDQLDCRSYNVCEVSKSPRRSSLPATLAKGRYAEVAPTPARSCLSPSPSRKRGFYPTEKNELVVSTQAPSEDREQKNEDENGNEKVLFVECPERGSAKHVQHSSLPAMFETTQFNNQEQETPDVESRASSSCCSKRADWSLFIFSPQNKFRQWNMVLHKNKWFDRVVLVFILLNCVVMAMEGPTVKDDSLERRVIDICMYIFLAIFTIEMFIKIIAMGLWFGKDTYLRSGWNVMDGFLVVVSWVDVIVTLSTGGQDNSILGVLRVFRALRTLRPLRVISRAPGIKIVVETLISSLKPIGNIVLIAATFFMIFGILGVQLFKGKFHHCIGASAEVGTRQQCIDKGGAWENKEYNFDNLAKALLTLFVFATKDGWVSIMRDGIDAVGIDMEPIQNYSRENVIYFVSFLLLAGFVVLNMLVGVVVENFKKCRKLIEMERDEEEKQREKDEKKRTKENQDADEESTHYSCHRRVIYRVCTHAYFDLAIAITIGLNVLCMALEHYEQPQGLEDFLKSANFVFTAIFIVEAILKIYVLGVRRYFSDRWNHLDMLIVILSIVGIVLEEMNNNLPINPTIIRVMRVLRIARVLKLLKTAEGIRKLLDTVLQALPQVGNLGMLFLLMFFIFAALGIELFGRIDCSKFECKGMDEHAHFKSFGVAMLTLFRISTGDNWNGILRDTINKKMCQENPEVDCRVLEHVAPIYFAVFVLATQFVLLNVVVAVLMKHLEDAKDDTSITGPSDSISSVERYSNYTARGKESRGVPADFKAQDPKVSSDEDSDDKQVTTVEINGIKNGGSTVPSVAINGEDLNSDSEYSTTSPLPYVKSMQRKYCTAMLSRSVPTLRPSLFARKRSSSAAPRIVKELGSSSSLVRLSPILGRLSKSNRYDDSDELVSHVCPVLEFTAMTNDASDVSPESEKSLSPRAPLYKMSQESDLYDSALEGDHTESAGSGSVSRTSKLSQASRPSLKSTQSTSTSSSGDDEQVHLPKHLRGKQTAWGGPDSSEMHSQVCPPDTPTPSKSDSTSTPQMSKATGNGSQDKPTKSAPVTSPDAREVAHKDESSERRPSTASVAERGEKILNYRQQSYV